MKFTRDDRSELFEKTEISDVFFTEYIAEMPPVAVKIYIYLLYYIKYNKDISLNDLPKILSISYGDMNSSLDYLVNRGLLIRKNSEYTIKPVEDLELNKLFKPKIGLSVAQIEKNLKNQNIENTITAINDKYFQGIMSTSWYNDIVFWFKKYKFSEEVMLALFQQGYKNGAVQHRNYLQSIADTWSKNNVTTYKDLDCYYEKLDKFNIIAKKVKKALKIRRELTSFEDEYIKRWVLEYNYDFDIIELALSETIKISNPSFKYIDKILSNWYDKMLKTPDDVAEYNRTQKEKQQFTKDIKQKNNKISKQTFNNLSDFYD